MTYDPTAQLIERGYTPREAAFLWLVGRFSGFFIGRQFTEFIQRERGALLRHFVRAAQIHDHIETLRCGPAGHVYHLKSRLIYRILECEDAQTCRLKGDDVIKIRLMILDFVLENTSRDFLSYEKEKLATFRDGLGIPEAELPVTIYKNNRVPGESAIRYFADRFPVGANCSHGFSFTYFDSGSRTVKPFLNHLSSYKRLLTTLGTFQLIYVADSKRNFTAATELFNKLFAISEEGCNGELLPFGVNHLLRFFAARQRWDSNSSEFSPEDLKYLKEGEKVYRRAEHEILHSAWGKGRALLDAQMKSLGLQREINGSFKPYLLARKYPIFGWRSAKKETSSAFQVPF